MKIEFTTEELHAVLTESFSFREKIISLSKRDVLKEYRTAIRLKFPFFAGVEKLPAIRWLREELRGKKNELREFESLNYEVYGPTLDLAAAKKFVESC